MADNVDQEDIMVMGEFNQWNPDLMMREPAQEEGKLRFVYRTKVPIGFKYRYQFIINGEITIDNRQPYNESNLGRLTNFKIAQQDE